MTNFFRRRYHAALRIDVDGQFGAAAPADFRSDGGAVFNNGSGR